MRIIHVYNHFHPCVGGVEKVMEDLCLNLKKLGHTSDVCCLNRCANSREELKPMEEHKGIKIHRIPYRDLKYYKVAPRVLKIIKNYDIIHIHGLGFFLDFLSSTKKIHGKPLILTTHGGIFHTRKLLRLKKIYFSFWTRHKLKRVDRIIAVSRNDERLFSRISGKVRFIPNGIDYPAYSGIQRRPEPNTLLFIGRITKNKRIDRLIGLVKELKSKGVTHTLYIAGSGSGEEKGKLENAARISGLEKHVIFLGNVSEKKKTELLSKAEIFVSASEYEGFGISVVEAMAAGVPVFANDIDAFRDLIENGKNGFIADFGRPSEVASDILKAKRQGLENISKESRLEAKKYDWPILSKGIEKIYNAIS